MVSDVVYSVLNVSNGVGRFAENVLFGIYGIFLPGVRGRHVGHNYIGSAQNGFFPAVVVKGSQCRCGRNECLGETQTE